MRLMEKEMPKVDKRAKLKAKKAIKIKKLVTNKTLKIINSTS